MQTDPIIRTRDLTRYYGDTVGVAGLDLDVGAGEVFGFLGPNGAGKTTTIRLLLDLIRPSKGKAALFGRPTTDASLRARVGYLPGELYLDGRMTGLQTLDFLSSLALSTSPRPHQRKSVCDRLGLTREDLRRRVREYSRGMKQKLGLVSAFQHDPELLILDEPTTGLDPLIREAVFDLMAHAKSRGATVFHSSHVLTEVDRTCDRVAVLREGRLAALLTVEEARRASTRLMVVEFGCDPPLSRIPSGSATIERIQGRRITLKVTGELNPLLVFLAEHPVEHLSFPEPSLNEAFKAFYRAPEADNDRTVRS